MDGVGRGAGEHWSGKVVDGGPFFWTSYTWLGHVEKRVEFSGARQIAPFPGTSGVLGDRSDHGSSF